jgi:hypothetical protein
VAEAVLYRQGSDGSDLGRGEVHAPGADLEQHVEMERSPLLDLDGSEVLRFESPAPP